MYSSVIYIYTSFERFVFVIPPSAIRPSYPNATRTSGRHATFKFRHQRTGLENPGRLSQRMHEDHLLEHEQKSLGTYMTRESGSTVFGIGRFVARRSGVLLSFTELTIRDADERIIHVQKKRVLKTIFILCAFLKLVFFAKFTIHHHTYFGFHAKR